MTYYIQSKTLCEQLGIRIKTSADNHKRLVTGFCGSMFIPSFIVTTKGIVTTCERDSDGETYGYGHFLPATKEFIFDEQKIVKNKAFRGLPAKCSTCFCKWHCAGDCPDVRVINYDRCYTVTHLTQHALESILVQGRKKKDIVENSESNY